MTFRRLQSLALIPIQHVHRAFGIIRDMAPKEAQMDKFLAYFKDTYMGPAPNELSPIFPLNNRNNQIDQPMNSTALSLNPPPPRRIVVGAVTRGHPIHPPAFWNIHKEAIEASPRTNNAMESSHCHFSKSLGCHTSMSDYLMAFWDNFDKQLDNNRSTKLMPATNANRKPRYVNRKGSGAENTQRGPKKMKAINESMPSKWKMCKKNSSRMPDMEVSRPSLEHWIGWHITLAIISPGFELMWRKLAMKNQRMRMKQMMRMMMKVKKNMKNLMKMMIPQTILFVISNAQFSAPPLILSI